MTEDQMRESAARVGDPSLTDPRATDFSGGGDRKGDEGRKKGHTDYEGDPEDDEAFWRRALEWLKGVPRELIERAMSAESPPGMTPVSAPEEPYRISDEVQEQLDITEGAKADKIDFDFEEERRRVATDNLKRERERQKVWDETPADGGGL